jgi:hypothetical protein
MPTFRYFSFANFMAQHTKDKLMKDNLAKLLNTKTTSNELTDWFRQASHQVQWSFYACLLVKLVTWGFVLHLGVSLGSGHISTALADSAISVISGIAIQPIFSLYQHTAKRFDEIVKIRLDKQC